MPDKSLKLRLIIEQGLDTLLLRDGMQRRVPVRVEVQNDASMWFQVLSSLDVSKEPHAGHRKAIRRLKDAIRPIVRAWEKMEDGQAEATIQASQEQLDLLRDLTEPGKLPEGVRLAGSAQDSVDDFIDFYRDLKDAKADGKDEPEGEEA